jgi:hypothetical protein
MTEQTIVCSTGHKGMVTNPEAPKVLTNETHVAIKMVPQTPKKIERGNLPTFPNVTWCSTPVLEEAPDTMVGRMDLTLFNDS